MEYWWSLFICIVVVIFCLFTPLIIFYFVKFWKYRRFDVVAKRRPKIVIAFTLITLLNILFVRCYFAILSNLSYSGYHVGVLNDPRIRTPAIWLTQLTANLLVCRIWILFYDWRRAVYLLQLKWSKQLLSNQQQHWTVRYRRIVGNETLLIVFSIIHYIAGVVACLIAIEVNHGENGLAYDLIIILDAAIFIAPFSFLLVVSQKFHDNFGVRDEIRGIAFLFAIGVLGFVCGAFITKDTIVRSQGSYALVAVISLCIVLRLLYVRKLNEYLNMNINNISVMERMIRSISIGEKKTEKEAAAPQNGTQNGRKIPLFKDVLKCEEGFKIFANHLLREYSVETLLFLLELTQIKRAIIGHYRELFNANSHTTQFSDIQAEIETAIDALSFRIDISPEILNLSDDVYKHITIDKVVNLWKYLYQQYIDESSSSCVNISHSVRMSILQQINKHNLLTTRRNNEILTADSKQQQQQLPNAKHQEKISNDSEETLPEPKKSDLYLAPAASTSAASSSSAASSRSRGSSGDEHGEHAVSSPGSPPVQIIIHPEVDTKSKQEWHGTIMELIIAFDCAAKEIYTLLETDSWQRFKYTQEFREWRDQIFSPITRKFTKT